jgi:hypothetical protein
MRRAWPVLPLLLTDCTDVDLADLDKMPALARREVPGEYRAVAACVADDLIRSTGRRFDYSVSKRPDLGAVTIRARAWDLWGLTTVQWRREVAFAPAGTCSGSRTSALGLANRAHFRLTLSGTGDASGLTINATGLTFAATGSRSTIAGSR